MAKKMQGKHISCEMRRILAPLHMLDWISGGSSYTRHGRAWVAPPGCFGVLACFGLFGTHSNSTAQESVGPMLPSCPCRCVCCRLPPPSCGTCGRSPFPDPGCRDWARHAMVKPIWFPSSRTARISHHRMRRYVATRKLHATSGAKSWMRRCNICASAPNFCCNAAYGNNTTCWETMRFGKKRECFGDEHAWGTNSAFDEDMAAGMQTCLALAVVRLAATTVNREQSCASEGARLDHHAVAQSCCFGA